MHNTLRRQTAGARTTLMDPVILTETYQLSAEWSWLFVAWIFPLGPAAFAAWWLARALHFE